MHLRREADPKGAADPHHVGHVAVVKALQKGRMVTVAGVGDDPGTRAPPRPCLIDQSERQCGFRLKRDRGGDVDFGPPGEIGRPRLGQRELRGHGPMHGGTARRLIGHRIRADDDLAVGDLA